MCTLPTIYQLPRPPVWSPKKLPLAFSCTSSMKAQNEDDDDAWLQRIFYSFSGSGLLQQQLLIPPGAAGMEREWASRHVSLLCPVLYHQSLLLLLLALLLSFARIWTWYLRWFGTSSEITTHHHTHEERGSFNWTFPRFIPGHIPLVTNNLYIRCLTYNQCFVQSNARIQVTRHLGTYLREL